MGDVMDLGDIAGIPVKTLTRIQENIGHYVSNPPSEEYLDMFRRGLWVTCPSMMVEEVSR